MEALKSNQYVFGGKFGEAANKICLDIGRKLSHQSDRSLGQTSFPSGYLPPVGKAKAVDSKTFKKCAHEMTGVLLVVLVYMLSSDNHDKLESRIGVDDMMGYIHVLDRLLTFEAWMKQTEFTHNELDEVEQFLLAFMTKYKEVLMREEGFGMKIIKFHLMLHIVDDIRRFGSPGSYFSGVGESTLKVKAKQTGRWTQMSASQN